MLKLTLLPDEYLTINGDIVVQLKRVAGGRADVAVDAPREMPVVRGTLLERQGGERIMELEALSLSMDGSLLTAELCGEGGTTDTLRLSLRSGEGAAR